MSQVWKGGTLHKRVCSSPFSATGKLGTLSAKGHTCEGNPIQASSELLNNYIINVNAAMSSFFIQDQLFSHPTSFLVDTGSPVSLIQSNVWNHSKPPGTVPRPCGGNKLVGVNGSSLNIQGSANVTITLMNRTFVCTMVIVDDITVDAILGLDFLEANQCSLAVGERLLHIPSCKCPIPVTGNCDIPTVVNVVMAETRTVPPYSKVEVMAMIPTTSLGRPSVLESTQTKTAVNGCKRIN